MGAKTGIEWTDATWNPVTGCSKVSPGCAHCYAERVAIRLWPTQYPPIVDGAGAAAAGEALERPRVFTDVQCHDDRLDQPLRWKKPRTVFVNSMSDLFHEDVPDAFIDRVFAVMALAPQHTFQILTKRAERMRDYAKRHLVPGGALGELRQAMRERIRSAQMPIRTDYPLPNVWLGVSVENRKALDRIIALNETPAAVRFLSLEPLLEDLELNPAWIFYIDWLIAGGESGEGARPCDLAWLRNIVQLGKGTGKPVFVKQIGAQPFDSTAVHLPPPELVFMRDRKGGDMAEWPSDLRVRQFPEAR